MIITADCNLYVLRSTRDFIAMVRCHRHLIQGSDFRGISSAWRRLVMRRAVRFFRCLCRRPTLGVCLASPDFLKGVQ